MFWVISVYFNIRNTLPNSRTFLLGHSVYNEVTLRLHVSTINGHLQAYKKHFKVLVVP